MGAHKIPKEPPHEFPNSLREGWEQYRDNTIPPTAPAVQLLEMRRAFFFGAATFFQIEMSHLEPTDDDEPTQKDLDLMTNLHEEIQEFMLAIKAGEA